MGWEGCVAKHKLIPTTPVDIVCMTTRRSILALYRQVWRLQRTLPMPMQALANLYIRHEFREHYDRGSEEQLQRFFVEWSAYVDALRKTTTTNTTNTTTSSIEDNLLYSDLTMEQRQRIELLERTIKKD